MSPNKKRKFSVPAAAPQLSAVASRRALKSKGQVGTVQNGLKESSLSALSGTVTPALQEFQTQQVQQLSEKGQSQELLESESITPGTPLILDEDRQASSLESRAASPEIPVERPSIVLSTFKPSKKNVRELKDGTLSLRLAPGERLAVLGQYEVSVQRGQITLLGTTLQASKTLHRVYAPSSHSLPVIRCLGTDIDDALINLHHCECGLGPLSSLSPLFGKLWNEDYSGPLGSKQSSLLRKSKHSTYQILFSSKDGPQKTYLQPLISPPEWNEVLARSASSSSQKVPSIMICGPKSSGKSTFARLLTNKLLYATVETSNRSKSAKPTGVALLDLDPGQPEYSPPGQLSLIHLHASNFGPPYSHPTPGAESRVIRSHSIGAVSPSLDPSLYMACALDLFAHYRNLLSLIANCPLIINTPGWVLGTGLEILVDLIAKVHPTEVIYMSQEGPVEVVESLREAGKSIPLITLPSQGSEYTTRTAAHLRTMQTMSYFHLDSSSSNGLAWKDSPLTSVPPWQISYSGEGGGILGIMCYGEQPPANLLADTIDGSLLAVVVIDEIAGIPGWESSGPMDTDEENAQNYTMPEHNDAEIRAFDEESFQPQNLEKPLIVQTPDEDIPYFNPANAMSLNPKYSHSIGLVLVRGIDVARRQLQVLTSIAPSVIEEINEAGKSIILVSGKLDTPGWAYTEEIIQKTKLEKASRKKGDAMDVDESDEEDLEGSDGKTERLLGDGFHDAPWIERLEGSQGRGLGARVWRVRRDLGRTGDRGD